MISLSVNTEETLSNIDDIAKILRDHIGVKSAASTPLIPHTQLSAIPRGNYNVTNSVDYRTLNLASVSLSQLAAVVATILSDLQITKIVGGTTTLGGSTPSGADTVAAGVYY